MHSHPYIAEASTWQTAMLSTNLIIKDCYRHTMQHNDWLHCHLCWLALVAMCNAVTACRWPAQRTSRMQAENLPNANSRQNESEFAFMIGRSRRTSVMVISLPSAVDKCKPPDIIAVVIDHHDVGSLNVRGVVRTASDSLNEVPCSRMRPQMVRLICAGRQLVAGCIHNSVDRVHLQATLSWQ